MRESRQVCPRVLLTAFALAGCSLGAQQAPPPWLEALHLASDSGGIKVFASPANASRAQQIRALIEPMLAFYKTKLGVTPDVMVAVLDSVSWARIPAVAPYPVPFVTNGVAVVARNPLSDDERRTLRSLPVTPPVPADAAATVRTWHRNPESLLDLVLLGRDVLAVHELGHQYTTKYGIATPRRWISEFLADYWSEAFQVEAFPSLTRFAREFVAASNPPPKPVTYTTLADFDRLSGPPAIPVLNYEWYQDAFTERVKQVYAQRGLGFLTQMRTAFPRAETAPLDDEEIIRRFERLSPGWREWITEFGANRR
jgi:hypothetical protein